MNFEDPAQALNMSDYFDFDYDADDLDPTEGPSSSNAVATPVQDTCGNYSYVGLGAADVAETSSLPDGSNALGVELQGTERLLADEGNLDNLQSSITASNSTGYFGAPELGRGDMDIIHPFGTPVDAGASFGDFTTLSPASRSFDVTDTFQTPVETHASPDGFSVFGPMASADTVDTAALERPPSPSRWVPVSSELQRHLNRVYAPQLARLAADPNPPPVLYLPAEGSPFPYMPSLELLPDHISTGSGYLQTPHQPIAKPLIIDPSLLMPSKGELPPPLSSLNGTYHPVAPVTDFYKPVAEDSISTPSAHKRALDARDLKSEPSSKRIKTAKMLPSAMDSIGPDTNDDAVMTRAKTGRQNSSPNVAVDDEEPDAKSDDEIEVPDNHNPSPKQRSNWRYEPSKEVRLRTRRVNEWNRRRANSTKTAEAPNRKSQQKMLGEIEDTKEFAEAQGCEAEENLGKYVVRRRPVRKGARKCYVGQQ